MLVWIIMIERFVKMVFIPEKVAEFEALFEEVRSRIGTFPGCQTVYLMQDVHQPNVLFTYSRWQDETALAQYRDSDLFRETWRRTKVLFADKPEAWSLEVRNSFPKTNLPQNMPS